MDGSLLIEPHYFPSIAYLVLLAKYPHVVLEVHEHYPKQTYRNRCYIQGANQVQLLSIPIRKVTGKVLTKDIRMESGMAWRHHHWRTLQSAYGNAPFFDFFASDFHDILYQKNHFLVDLTIPILTKCLEIVQLLTYPLTYSQSYQRGPSAGIFDARNVLTPALPPSWPGFFQPVSYPQVFGKDFAPNLSVIDLLFCEGSQANSIIHRSIAYPE